MRGFLSGLSAFWGPWGVLWGWAGGFLSDSMPFQWAMDSLHSQEASGIEWPCMLLAFELLSI